MTKSGKTLKFIALLFLGFSFFGCQQEGCTDKNALNYSIVAKKDDGTCLYCQVTELSSSKENTTAYDQRDEDENGNNNPYYATTILRFNFDQHTLKTNSDKCTDATCYIEAKVTNLINKKITAKYSFNFNSRNVTFTVNPGETVYLGKIETSISGLGSMACSSLDNSSVSVQQVGYISYQ